MSHIQGMPRNERRAVAKQLQRDNSRYPEKLAEVPRMDWPEGAPSNLLQAWRSRDFLAQLYQNDGFIRLSINRTSLASNGRWKDEISWEELQRLKSEAGFGDCDAVEVYPRDVDVVNVANMRHLWIFFEPLEFAWRAKS